MADFAERQAIRTGAWAYRNIPGMRTVGKSMIKEAVAEYFKESYERQITEQAIKKTINVLIKEGKINTKK